MSIINSTVKPFNATAFHNGKFVPISDKDLRGKWSVIVFYPADFTFVCPTELGDLADHYDTFKSMGVEVYSVSTTTASAVTPRSCCARCRLPSTLRATRARSAPPSGRRARRRWPPRWTWSARSEVRYPLPRYRGAWRLGGPPTVARSRRSARSAHRRLAPDPARFGGCRRQVQSAQSVSQAFPHSWISSAPPGRDGPRSRRFH